MSFFGVKQTMKEKANIAIKVENVSKTFYIPTERKESIKSYFLNPFHRAEKKKFEALQDITFEIQKGEFLGIIGRNGSGKSTLLKILAGIYLPDKGKVTVNGKVVPFLELGVGFNPELSGRENIYLNGTILGMSKRYLEKNFDKIIDFAEVKEFIDMPLKNYSSGMQVRLAFAISTIADGDIYLMDEVLAVGDTNFQSRCLEKFNFYREQGKTTILVTHDVDSVRKFCDRGILLREGRISIINETYKVVNKYIYQNMSDEEKRLTKDKEKEEKVKAKLISKSKGVAEVLRLGFLDKDNIEKDTFKTGDKINIQVDFRILKEVKEINVGISLETDDGQYVLGYNTRVDDYKVSKVSGIKRVELSFDSLKLLKNTYFVSVALFGKEGEVRFDFKPRFKGFKVYSFGSEAQYIGILSLDHKWDEVPIK